MKRTVPTLIALLLASCLSSFGQASPTSPKFIENKGQWEQQTLYKLRFKNGAMFAEKDRLTFCFLDVNDLEKIEEYHHARGNGITTFPVHGHAYSMRFENSNPLTQAAGNDSYSFYENYFIGNDPSKWASQVGVFKQVKYHNLYQGIDMTLKEKNDHLEYSFIIQPGSTPSAIQIAYEGLNNISLFRGKLYYSTSVNNIHEERPYAFQEINGETVRIPCRFVLNGNKITFECPQGYDPNYPLVIDPVLVFGTFTGSLADNFGYTATYDNQGNFYVGGIARDVGYPVTPGAFQATFAGGVIIGNFELGYNADISITKYNPAGTALIYSTYLGGAINDQPHSLIVNQNQELHIYGRSNSSNYPVTPTAFDTSYNGGTDIVVTIFNSTGSALLGSTYIGGALDDGANVSPAPYNRSSLKFNYADDARGEIILDNNGNVFVASCTRSSDFPVTPGAFQSTLNGSQDGCIFKFNSNVSSLTWSSYIGGSNDDAAYSMVLDDQNNLYLCGGTNSTNFPSLAGGLNAAYIGGTADGFVVKINNSGTTLLNTSFIGTSNYDQAYFVQLDGDDNVYLYGQTSSGFPVTSGVYSNPNSGQFIISLTPNLATINFSTVFGKGDGDPDLSPTAFLVDNCRNIYISGWGGLVNFSTSNFNTFGLPITSDAYQSTTDGSDFYFLVLSKDAATLRYATYFGGPVSHEHVDGGTSRFDKNGVIYEAVCAGCGGNSDFPTTPGAWSQTNNSANPFPNCNEGAAKFQFELIGVDVDVQANPTTEGCTPFTVNFAATGTNAKEWFWNLGDNTFSTDSSFTKTYNLPGTYSVKLIGLDSTSCDGLVFTDTAYTSIEVFAHPSFHLGPDESICFGDEITLTATGGISYDWNTGDSVASITLTPIQTSAYWVTVTDANGCSSVDTIMVEVLYHSRTILFEEICQGETFFVAGANQSEEGTYYDSLVAFNGCDSIVETHLIVNRSVATIVQAESCTSDPVLLSHQNPVCSTDSLGNVDPVSCTNLANMSCSSGDTIGGFLFFNGTSSTYSIPNPICEEGACQRIVNVALEVTYYDFEGFPINADIFLNNNYLGTINVGDALVYKATTISPGFVGLDTADGGYYSNWRFNSSAWNGLEPASVNWFTQCIVRGSDTDYWHSFRIIITYETCLGSGTSLVLTYDTLTAFSGCDSIVMTETTYLPPVSTILQSEYCTTDSSLINHQNPACITDSLGNVDPASCPNHIYTQCAFDSLIDPPFLFFSGSSPSYNNFPQCDAGECRSITNVVMEVTYFEFEGFPIKVNVFLRNTQLGTIDISDGLVYNLNSIPPSFVDLDTADGAYYSTWRFTSSVWNGTDPANINWIAHCVNFGSDVDSWHSYRVIIAYETCLGSGTASFITTDTLTAFNGCDSILVTETTYLPSAASTVNPFICQGDSYFAGGANQTTSGIYFDTLTAEDGCDSIIITDLTVLSVPVTNINASICEGEIYFAGGDDQTTQGIYFDTLVAEDGCDSIIITDLSVLPTPTTNIDISICDGKSYFAGGADQTSSGIYFDTLSTADGCDSIVITALSVLPISASQQSIHICDGDSIFAGGGFQYSAGTYFDTLVAANGCDSIISTNLTVSSLNLTFDIQNVSCSCNNTTNPVPDSVPAFCSLDFSGLPHGTILSEQFAAQGIHISGDAYGSYTDKVIVFNSNLSGTPDPDLEAGIGNLAIFPTTITDNNGDGLVDVPDDQGAGGKMIFTFDSERTIYSLVIVDNENGGTIRAYGAANALLSTINIPIGSNGSVQTININVSGVLRLEIDYRDSRGVGDIRLSCPPIQSSVCSIDLAPFSHGTIITNQFDADGIHISANAHGSFPDQVIVFNSDLSGTPDPDLEVHHGNLFIFPTTLTDNNGDGLVDIPDDQGAGGTLTFTFDAERTVYSLVMVDNENGGTIRAYDAANNLITSISIPTGYNGSVQTININASGVTRLEIDYRDSRGVADIRISCPQNSCAVDLEALSHGTILNSQFASQGIHISGDAHGSYVDQVIIFNSNSTGTPDPDLEVGIGNLIIFPENISDANGDGLVDVPNDQGSGGKMIFTFDNDRTVYSFKFVDNDRNGGSVKAYDQFNNLILSKSTPSLTNGSIQTVTLNISGVRRLEIEYTDSRGVADLELDCMENCCDGSVLAIPAGGLAPYQYLWSNGSTTASLDSLCEGTYWITVTDSFGCVIMDSVIIGKDSANTSHTVVEICEGDSVLAGGSYQTQPGFYTDTLGLNGSCYDISITELIIHPVYTDSLQVEICAGDSFFVGGDYQMISGIYSDTLASQYGCDSIILTELVVHPTYVLNIQQTICEGESYFTGGANQTESGTYFDSLKTTAGCDSIIATELSVLPTSTTFLHFDVCTSDTTLLGQTPDSVCALLDCCCCCPWLIPQTVSQTDTLQMVEGCDSIVTMETTYYPIYDKTFEFTICEGDSFFAAGDYQTQSGIFVDSFTIAGACDSVVTTVLTVNPKYQFTEQVSICEGDSILAAGAYQTQSGIYADSLVTYLGCDSIIVTELTVYPASTSNQQVNICDGESYFAGSDFQTTTGIYVDSLLTANGCDSIVITDLTVHPSPAIATFVDICEGDSIFAAGAWQTTSGTYSDTFQTSDGCDSISSILLTVFSADTTLQHINICEGDSFFAGGAFQTVSGTYFDVLQNINGCDSIVQIELSVSLPVISSLLVTDVNCNGGTDGAIDLTVQDGVLPYTYIWSTNHTTENITGLSAGSYSVTVIDFIGCTVETTANVIQPDPLALGATSVPVGCAGESDGSVDLLVLGGTPPYTYSWSIGATSQDIGNLEAGTYTVTVTDSNGCNATLITLVDEPDEILLSGIVIDVSTAGGNDGAIDLSVNGGTPPYNYNWSNGDTTEDLSNLLAGTYYVTVTDNNGCEAVDSFVVNEAAIICAEWIRTGNSPGEDVTRAVTVDKWGNVYSTGYFSSTANFSGITVSSNGNTDIFLNKYDSDGNLIWIKTAGSASGPEYGDEVVTDGNGDIIISGAFRGTATFGSTTLIGAGSSEAFLAKYDSSGSVIWAKRMGGNSIDRAFGLASDQNNNIYVSGYFSGSGNFDGIILNSAGSTDIFVAKFSPSGAIQWAKRFGNSIADEQGAELRVDANGNLYISGFFTNTVAFDSFVFTSISARDAYVLKMDNNGNVVWAHQVGGSVGWDEFKSVDVDPNDGSVYACGNFSGNVTIGSFSLVNNGNEDILLAKYDSSGNLVWIINGGSSQDDIAGDMEISNSGEIYVTGLYNAGFTFGAQTFTHSGQQDGFIAKFDRNGNILFLRTVNSAGNDIGESLYLDNNFIYFCGRYSNAAAFNNTTLNATGNVDAFVWKICEDDTAINNPVISQRQITICDGDSIFAGGSFQTEAGIFYDTLSSSAGADSIIITEIINGYVFQDTSISGIINSYASVISIDTVNCPTQLVVDNTSGFRKCGKVLIIQMKGATIDLSNNQNFGTILNFNNAGNYEFGVIQSIDGNIITLDGMLSRSYNTSGIVQLISVPQYNNVTVSGTLTAQPWNGTTGGVLAFEAMKTLMLDSNIDVSGLGFRGGMLNTPLLCVNNNESNYYYPLNSTVAAQKGEGIADYIPNYESGRGPLANGGGGGQCKNAGGGGGANSGAGGIGGKGFNILSNSIVPSGLGGLSLNYSNPINKIFLGGGAGSGQQDDGGSGDAPVGTPGENGGGIIVILADSVIGNANVLSNGNDQLTVAGTDGAGGGGAGGTILLNINAVGPNISIHAKGGKGGDNNNTKSFGFINNTYCHAPGGGGGGGIIWSSIALNSSSTDVSGGAAGLTVNSGSPCYNTGFGAMPGQDGTTLTNLSLTNLGSCDTSAQPLPPVQPAKGGAFYLTIYPNPFRNQINFKFHSLERGSANIRILDILGQKIMENNWEVDKGDNEKTLLLHNSLPAGIYVLEFRLGKEIIIAKIIRE